MSNRGVKLTSMGFFERGEKMHTALAIVVVTPQETSSYGHVLGDILGALALKLWPSSWRCLGRVVSEIR